MSPPTKFFLTIGLVGACIITALVFCSADPNITPTAAGTLAPCVIFSWVAACASFAIDLATRIKE